MKYKRRIVSPQWHQTHSTLWPIPAMGPVLATRGWFRMSSKWNVSWRQTCYSHCVRELIKEKKKQTGFKLLYWQVNHLSSCHKHLQKDNLQRNIVILYRKKGKIITWLTLTWVYKLPAYQSLSHWWLNNAHSPKVCPIQTYVKFEKDQELEVWL